MEVEEMQKELVPDDYNVIILIDFGKGLHGKL